MNSNFRSSGSIARIRRAIAKTTSAAFFAASVVTVAAGVVAVATLLAPTPVAAQSSYTAQLSGVVSDSSGGVIPGAKVTLTDEGTGVASTLSTDERGIFVFTG